MGVNSSQSMTSAWLNLPPQGIQSIPSTPLALVTRGQSIVTRRSYISVSSIRKKEVCRGGAVQKGKVKDFVFGDLLCWPDRVRGARPWCVSQDVCSEI